MVQNISMKIGYARVTREDCQDIATHLASLKAAGCEHLFCDEGCDAQDTTKPQLAAALARLKPGDILCVWKIDRLSRSLHHLLFTLERIEQAGAAFQSLTEMIDTISPSGRLMMRMLCALIELERAVIRERTLQGLEIARKTGRHLGRKPKLRPAQKAEIIRMIEEGIGTTIQVANLFNVSRSTVKRVLQAHRSAET